MWVKKLDTGQTIIENRKHGKTWRRTAQHGIVEVYIYHKGHRSPPLTGYKEYWHSRGATMNPQTGEVLDVIERIQGLRDDGQWDTIERRGEIYVRYIAPKALGKIT